MMSSLATKQTPSLSTEPFRCKSLLLLTDFSDNSRKAFAYAAGMARHFNSSLHILHAVEYGANERGLIVPEIEDTARQQMQSLATDSSLRGIEHTEHVAVGPLSMLVEELLAKYQTDLIISATHVPKVAERLVFGSTSEWIARTSTPACILLGKNLVEKPFRISRILFATALKPDSLRSAQYAAGLALSTGATLTIMHVVEEADGRNQAITERLKSLLCDDLGTPFTVVEHGDVISAILRQAEERNVDLIVMGLRSAAFAHHAPWAHVSEVLAYARCPVLAVPEHLH